MKTLAALGFLALLLTGSSALAKDLEFSYPCRAYQYEGNNEIDAHVPGVSAYTFLKTARVNKERMRGENKWVNSYSVRVTKADGSAEDLALEHSGSGDEGYEEYHAVAPNYSLSSGSVYNDGSGASFEGQDAKGKSVFFECRK
jgi:hypothetical protein